MQLKHLLEQNGLLSDAAPGRIEYATSGTAETLVLMRRLMTSLDEH